MKELVAISVCRARMPLTPHKGHLAALQPFLTRENLTKLFRNDIFQALFFKAKELQEFSLCKSGILIIFFSSVDVSVS